ncbi:MAG: DNA/RNA nuclease SfsA [Microcystaceae cyanobacterium]
MLYTYPPLLSGKLIKRYKRFLADIELDSGEIITAHCPNTGPMTGVCTPNSKVYVSQSDNPKRKLAYTWELIEVNDTQPTWVGINTALPNKVIKIALEKELIPELKGQYTEIRSEVPYGENKKSRIDLLLTKENEKPIYLEIKNTTLCSGKKALFPDTVTTRGQKHLRELMALLPTAQPMMLYFINRSDCDQFAPAEAYDPTYAQLFDQAVELGVKMLPCRFEVTPQGIRYLGLASIA